MTQHEFFQSLESILRKRRIGFCRGAAIVFVQSCWGLIEDNPDLHYWADRFIEANLIEVFA